MGNRSTLNMEEYSLEWFCERAVTSLKRIEENVWDYSDSLLLYVPDSEGEYETIQVGDDPYVQLITRPERAYLDSIAPAIVAQLPSEFEYIDLGPGTAHKEQSVFDEAKRTGKNFVYRPVDISEHYLKLAAGHAKTQGIQIDPLKSSFEELPERLGLPKIPRFVSLGLTFSNYQPEYILRLLKRIAGIGGEIFIDAQIRDRVVMEDVLRMYREDLYPVVDPKLAFLDVDPKTDVSERSADEGVRLWYTLKHTNPKLEALGVHAGDKLLMLQSLRYSVRSLEEELAKTGSPFVVFDTNASFVGACIKA